MQHNTVGHGYGIQRDVRVTARSTTGIGGATPLSATLGDLPHVMNANIEPGTKSVMSRPAIAEPDSRYEITRPENLGWRATHNQRVDSEIAWFGTEPEPRTKARHQSTRHQTDAERADTVARWVNQARNMINPVRFIMTDVPVALRNEVMVAAASA